MVNGLSVTSFMVYVSHQILNFTTMVGSFGKKNATLRMDNGRNKNLGSCAQNWAIISQVWKEVHAQDEAWILFLPLNAADQR